MRLSNQDAADTFRELKAARPLIHHLTNFVAINDSANLTLHLGALPVMAHALEEIADVTPAAGALVLNFGMLSPARLEEMRFAASVANARGIPVVLDPVGVGAIPFRTQSCRQLLEAVRVAVVRGNPGEVAALIGIEARVQGVESISSALEPAELALRAAAQLGTVVAVTGPKDYISDGTTLIEVSNGTPLLALLTATGCMATTAIACFAATHRPFLQSTAAALAAWGLAAENAARDAQGPASFKVALLDAAFKLTPGDVAQGARQSLLAGSLEAET